MKTIKHMSVKCTYRVGLYNVEVPDSVYEQFQEYQDFNPDDPQNDDACQWLSDNIREADAYEWEFQVEVDN